MRNSVFVLALLPWAAYAAAADSQPEVYWCANADSVYAVVEDSTITICHDAALYNCCPERFDYSVTQCGSRITVRETMVAEDVCACLCCFDLSVDIGPFASGEYVIDFSWFDTEGDQWVHRLLDVTVSGGWQSAGMTVLSVSSSECIPDSSAAGVEPPGDSGGGSGTWGAIKSLFR